MAKKLLCAKGCGKPFKEENAWKKKHEEKCGGEKEKSVPKPFKPADHDPESEPETTATEPVEEVTLPKKPRPNGTAIAAAIDELMKKRKAHLLEVQKIDALVAQLEAVN